MTRVQVAAADGAWRGAAWSQERRLALWPLQLYLPYIRIMPIKPYTDSSAAIMFLAAC